MYAPGTFKIIRIIAYSLTSKPSQTELHESICKITQKESVTYRGVNADSNAPDIRGTFATTSPMKGHPMPHRLVLRLCKHPKNDRIRQKKAQKTAISSAKQIIHRSVQHVTRHGYRPT